MSTLRLSGGQFGGRRLAVPASARPTEGRVREALLSIWQERLPSATILDLYAGSGAVGLEALGRGATRVVFVERGSAALGVLRRNIAALGVEAETRVVRGRLPSILERLKGTFDLVFADPPYADAEHAALLRAAAPRLAPGGELALEHRARQEAPERAGELLRNDIRIYGESALAFYGAVETS